jgi:hypothetical protein
MLSLSGLIHIHFGKTNPMRRGPRQAAMPERFSAKRTRFFDRIVTIVDAASGL